MPTKKFTDKEAALIQTANAKAKAAGKVTVKKVAAAPAANATEKAPHTKRAVQQNAQAEKLAKAQARVAAALKAVTAATRVANKTGKAADTPTSPERLAAFQAKTKAELELQAARKALQTLQRENETPEERQARLAAQKTATPKAPRAPRVAQNRTIKPGAVKYENAKGGWTLYMVTLALKHKTTDEATAAHKAGAAKAGQNPAKPLDFKWMDAKGYIVLA